MSEPVTCPMCGTPCQIGGEGTTHYYIPTPAPDTSTDLSDRIFNALHEYQGQASEDEVRAIEAVLGILNGDAPDTSAEEKVVEAAIAHCAALDNCDPTSMHEREFAAYLDELATKTKIETDTRQVLRDAVAALLKAREEGEP